MTCKHWILWFQNGGPSHRLHLVTFMTFVLNPNLPWGTLLNTGIWMQTLFSLILKMRNSFRQIFFLLPQNLHWCFGAKIDLHLQRELKACSYTIIALSAMVLTTLPSSTRSLKTNKCTSEYPHPMCTCIYLEYKGLHPDSLKKIAQLFICN